MKVLEENIPVNLYDSGFYRDGIKSMNNFNRQKIGLNQNLKFFTSKYTIKKAKRKSTEWEKDLKSIYLIRIYYPEYPEELKTQQ